MPQSCLTSATSFSGQSQDGVAVHSAEASYANTTCAVAAVPLETPETFSDYGSLPSHSLRDTSQVSNAEASDQDMSSSPQAARLASLFPQQLCRSIRKRNDGTAFADMVIPKGRSPSSNRSDERTVVVSLALQSWQMPWLVSELGGASLEADEGRWCIINDSAPSGFRVSATGDGLRMDGFRMESVERVFGSEVSNAIAASSVRRAEVARAQLGTYCVKLLLPSDSSMDHCLLIFTTGLKEGWQIHEKLFCQRIG